MICSRIKFGRITVYYSNSWNEAYMGVVGTFFFPFPFPRVSIWKYTHPSPKWVFEIGGNTVEKVS
jgi:hypothetical protein